MTALPFAPTIDVVAASSPSSFAAALPLLVAARSSLDRLLYELIGIDLASAQPSSRAEFADPSAFYSPRDGRLVVALVDGVARGIFGVRRLEGPVGELKRMFVAPEARGRGLGGRLLSTVLEQAPELGLEVVRLETLPAHMPAAVRLYRETGFRPVPPYRELPEGLDVLTMELRLETPANSLSR